MGGRVPADWQGIVANRCCDDTLTVGRLKAG